MNGGILLVDKPQGCTSAEVVRQIKRHHRLRSIGHLGTLDPMATGLLPLCIAGGTRIAQFLAADAKAYSGRIRLGIATDTLDITGQVVRSSEVRECPPGELDQVSAKFLGERDQVPPMYSAVKIGGRKLHELARAGIEVERTARRIQIERLKLTPAGDRTDELAFEVECSKGTYVRVLAEEIGDALGMAATLSALTRTRFGRFLLSEAHSLESLLQRPSGDLPLISERQALREIREFQATPKLAFAVAVGRSEALRELPAPCQPAEIAALIAPNDQLLAIVGAAGPSWELRRVLMPEAAQLYRL